MEPLQEPPHLGRVRGGQEKFLYLASDFEAPAKVNVAIVFVLQNLLCLVYIFMYILRRSEIMEEVLAFKANGFSICLPWYLDFIYCVLLLQWLAKASSTLLICGSSRV